MANNARVILICRAATLVLLFTLLALVLRGPLDVWINDVALGRLDYNNQQYLEHSFDDASRLFLILTGVKSVLAVVEGSEVGVGFGLQVGDIVQGVYDYVDFAWRIVLWATMIIVMTRMLLEVSQFVDQWLLVLALASMILFLATAWFMPRRRAISRVLRDTAFFSTLLAVAAYVIVPLAVSGGAFLSREITNSRTELAAANITRVNAELNERFSAIESADGLFGKASQAKEATGALIEFLKVRTGELFWDVITVSAAYLFDTVLFPLGLFFVMFWLTRLLGKYIFGLRQGQVFREDLETLMGRYWAKRERAEPPVADERTR